MSKGRRRMTVCWHVLPHFRCHPSPFLSRLVFRVVRRLLLSSFFAMLFPCFTPCYFLFLPPPFLLPLVPAMCCMVHSPSFPGLSLPCFARLPLNFLFLKAVSPAIPLALY